MLQRTLLRSSRSLASRTPSQSISRQLRASPSPFISSTRSLATSTRWRSEATNAKEEAKQAAGEKIQEKDLGSSTPPASSSEGGAEVEKLRIELEAKKKEIINLKDAYVRSVADYRNLQDRTTREKASAHDFALQKFARDLIPSIDTLSLSLSSIPGDRIPANPSAQAETDLVNLHKGVALMETVLLDVLKKHGLIKSDPAKEGEKFDPNVHEAVFMAPQPDKEDGLVFHTQTPGYILNGRVLRAAQVGVVKNS